MKIIFYIGKSIESWSPKSVATGIGGSEEATIQMAKNLSSLGNEVVVYNRCDKDCGSYDGVEYRDYKKYKNDKCDILIFWRGGDKYIDLIKSARAKKQYIWLHDTTPEAEILPVVYLVDKIMVLSLYHRSLYPNIPNEKMFITQNGVDISQFNQKVKRNPKKIIYMSSYDRGLKELLETWTTIKLAEPEAELHIFYGWQTMKKILDKKTFKVYKEYLENLFSQEGVYHHGRVGHIELAKQILSSGVWAYPTHWPEISCISSMKAQVGGAIPVVIPTAAVAETTRWGLTTNWSYDHFPNREIPEKVFDMFADLVIKALNPRYQNKYREEMMADARERFDWKKVAKDWQKEFKS